MSGGGPRDVQGAGAQVLAQRQFDLATARIDLTSGTVEYPLTWISEEPSDVASRPAIRPKSWQRPRGAVARFDHDPDKPRIRSDRVSGGHLVDRPITTELVRRLPASDRVRRRVPARSTSRTGRNDRAPAVQARGTSAAAVDVLGARSVKAFRASPSRTVLRKRPLRLDEGVHAQGHMQTPS